MSLIDLLHSKYLHAVYLLAYINSLFTYVAIFYIYKNQGKFLKWFPTEKTYKI